MPPPPPSKSYLWKFDNLTDSDSDDDDRYYSNQVEREHSERSVPSASIASTRNEIVTKKDTFSSDRDKHIAPSSKSPRSVIQKTYQDETYKSSVVPTILPSFQNVHIIEDDEDDLKKENLIDQIRDDDDGGSDDDEDDDEENDNDGEPSGDTENLKKKRKKKKGKKKKKNKKKGGSGSKSQPSTTVIKSSMNTVTALSKKTKLIKNISFDSVMLTEFERCFGLGTVPFDGGWPLGMSNTISSPNESTSEHQILDERIRKNNPDFLHSVSTNLSIDEFESFKALKLVERLNKLKTNKNEDLSDLKEPLETRQWDYKRKCKNPLFRSLDENERMEILITHSSTNQPAEGNISLIPSIARRIRAGSFSDILLSTTSGNQSASSTSSSSNNKTKGRSRAYSIDKSVSEIYNDKYTQVEVHSIRNELEQIRNFRSAEESNGCTCRKLQVYLMPADGGGGKKANHRRMKLQQVKLELRKRHLLPNEEKTREELELLLHDIIENEPCCSNDNCPCVHNGIGCQADTCSCWYLSHQTSDQQKKMKQVGDDDSYISVSNIQNRCGNINGMYAVDVTTIDEFRKKYIYCELISTKS